MEQRQIAECFNLGRGETCDHRASDSLNFAVVPVRGAFLFKRFRSLTSGSGQCRGSHYSAQRYPLAWPAYLRSGEGMRGMKWFKHMVDMQDDERIGQLFESHGHRGVLTYIWILERIAAKMDDTDRCNLQTSKQHWAKMLRTYWKDADKILTRCRDLGLIFLTSSGDLVDISCPKLLKIRARKKPIGCKTGHTDIEVEVEVDKEIGKSAEKRTLGRGKNPPPSLGEKRKKKESSLATLVRSGYQDKYKSKYGVRPKWGARENVAANSLLAYVRQEKPERDPVELVSEMVAEYLNQNGRAADAKHPFAWLAAYPQNYLAEKEKLWPTKSAFGGTA